ncbi:GNAT family N-acetyltransferase [Caldalkalibacillus thermarum]|uniref:GNAT family N-acetyltransferase n=1 Tax=Caldalkalibacillus thermarum TaxID=296745 RepID=UPI001666C20F|nr:GNAT family N-acetyltransferase [Caldalkalibacillus thermarum]
MGYTIQAMTSEHWEQVRDIYLEGIKTGMATFETEAPSWYAWDQSHLRHCRLVAKDGEAVLGWVALSPVSGRCVYAGVAEVSIYIGQRYRGRGVGAALLHALIKESEDNGIWTLQSGIFPENQSSLALHRKCGFREVGRRERIGQLNGVWKDIILMERRSSVVGV